MGEGITEHVYSQEAEYIKILKVTIKYNNNNNNNNNNSKIQYMLKWNRRCPKHTQLSLQPMERM